MIGLDGKNYNLVYKKKGTHEVLNVRRLIDGNFKYIDQLTGKIVPITKHFLEKEYYSTKVNKKYRGPDFRKCKTYFDGQEQEKKLA